MTIPAPEMTELRAMLTKVHDWIANTIFADDERRDEAVNLDNDILATLGAHPIGDTQADGLVERDADASKASWRQRAERAEARLAASERRVAELELLNASKITGYRDEAIAAVERERDAVQTEWYGAFTDRVVAEHGTTIDILSKRLNEYAERIAASERERDEAVQNADTVCNSYAAENQRLFDRAEASEAKVLALTTALDAVRPSHRGPGCWCSIARDVESQGHAEGCLKARAALEQATPYDPTTQPFDEPFRHEQAKP